MDYIPASSEGKWWSAMCGATGVVVRGEPRRQEISTWVYFLLATERARLDRNLEAAVREERHSERVASSEAKKPFWRRPFVWTCRPVVRTV